MNLTKRGLIHGFLLGAVFCSVLWGYVLYSKIIELETQIGTLEERNSQEGLSDFDLEILYYYSHGAQMSIGFNGTNLSYLLSLINNPELYQNVNVYVYNVSKLELREQVSQHDFTSYVYADASREALYYYYEGAIGENGRRNVIIYTWSPKIQ